MSAVVRGRPVALVGYSEDMLPVTRGTYVDVDTYAWAVGAFAGAPSDLPACVGDWSSQVRGLLTALERADGVPGAFGRALQALDDDQASRTGTAEVSDAAALAAAFDAALADPTATVLDLQQAAEGAGDPAVVAWDEFTKEFVSRASAATTGVDATGQIGRWGNRAITWLDLVITESNFDAYSGRGPWATRLDASADAAIAAMEATKETPSFVDDALKGVPAAGERLAVAGKVVGWSGVAIGAIQGSADLAHGHHVDGSVALAGAGASAALMTGWFLVPLGPVGLGTAATVAVASIVYENRQAIGGAILTTVDAVGEAATSVGGAVTDAAGAIGRGARRLWPW